MGILPRRTKCCCLSQDSSPSRILSPLHPRSRIAISSVPDWICLPWCSRPFNRRDPELGEESSCESWSIPSSWFPFAFVGRALVVASGSFQVPTSPARNSPRSLAPSALAGILQGHDAPGPFPGSPGHSPDSFDFSRASRCPGQDLLCSSPLRPLKSCC